MWAATAASYCPSTTGELSKQNMTKSHERWDQKLCTGIGARMSHRKWRETKQHPSRTSSGHQVSCFLFSLHFLCDILAPIPVENQLACYRCLPRPCRRTCGTRRRPRRSRSARTPRRPDPRPCPDCSVRLRLPGRPPPRLKEGKFSTEQTSAEVTPTYS